MSAISEINRMSVILHSSLKAFKGKLFSLFIFAYSSSHTRTYTHVHMYNSIDLIIRQTKAKNVGEKICKMQRDFSQILIVPNVYESCSNDPKELPHDPAMTHLGLRLPKDRCPKVGMEWRGVKSHRCGTHKTLPPLPFVSKRSLLAPAPYLNTRASGVGQCGAGTIIFQTKVYFHHEECHKGGKAPSQWHSASSFW